MNKVISYIGFARKSHAIITGQTSIKRAREQLYVILVCFTASENLKNLAKNVAVKHNCPYIITNVLLSELTNIEDIKILAITDENLARGIINERKTIEIKGENIG